MACGSGGRGSRRVVSLVGDQGGGGHWVPGVACLWVKNLVMDWALIFIFFEGPWVCSVMEGRTMLQVIAADADVSWREKLQRGDGEMLSCFLKPLRQGGWRRQTSWLGLWTGHGSTATTCMREGNQHCSHSVVEDDSDQYLVDCCC